MNKKIEELAHRAVAESGQEFWWLTNDLCIEKFAELIIDECMTLCNCEDAQDIMIHFRDEKNT